MRPGIRLRNPAVIHFMQVDDLVERLDEKSADDRVGIGLRQRRNLGPEVSLIAETPRPLFASAAESK